jgi:ABC-2 type transport system permease protein
VTGLGTLLRLFLRRDRWMLLWWTIGITFLYWVQAISVDRLYATQEEFDVAAAAMEGNAAFVAMAGPARALNTVGGQVTWQSSAFGAITIGLLVMFLVGRHTRGEEDSARDELLRAAPVHRSATTLATALEVLLASLLVGLAVAASLVGYGLATADSLGLGLGLTAVGLAFGAVALLLAQVAPSTRATYGLTGVVLGASYVLRAVGDVSAPALSWLSPIGWYQAMWAFSGLRWWPALLLLALAGVALAGALAVFVRRDFDQGLRPTRPGPATAGRGLGTPVGLAWRLQRGSVLGWGLGMAFVGVTYGSMGDDVGEVMGDSDVMQQVLAPGDELVTGFYAVALVMLALMAAGFTVSSALRPRHEEDEHRTELLSSAPLHRPRLLTGPVLVTGLGSVVVLGLSGGGLGLGYGVMTSDWDLAGELAVGMLGYLPPVLVLASLAWLLYGLVPRHASLAWLGLGLCVVVLFFGDLLDLPRWLRELSPFEHVALVPVEDFRWPPVLVLTAIAVAGTALAHLAFRRRDLR